MLDSRVMILSRHRGSVRYVGNMFPVQTLPKLWDVKFLRIRRAYQRAELEYSYPNATSPFQGGSSTRSADVAWHAATFHACGRSPSHFSGRDQVDDSVTYSRATVVSIKASRHTRNSPVESGTALDSSLPDVAQHRDSGESG